MNYAKYEAARRLNELENSNRMLRENVAKTQLLLEKTLRRIEQNEESIKQQRLVVAAMPG